MAGKEINCPSCGGGVPLLTQAATVASCPYCSTLMVPNPDAVEALGKMALLADTPSCLAIGWPAKAFGKPIIPLGRIQLKYDRGLWDEWWFGSPSDGKAGWISQDEGVYMLEVPIQGAKDIPAWDSVVPGDVLTLAGEEYQVEEKDHAIMVGAQGELPFKIIPNEAMHYLDLGNENRKATISYFADGHIEVYTGHYFGEKELKSDVRPEMQQAPPSPYKPPQQSNAQSRFKKAADGLKPNEVKCQNCGGTVALRDPSGTSMVVCNYCGSSLDVSSSDSVKLITKAATKKREYPLKIGQKCRYQGNTYMIIGRVDYRQVEDGLAYTWRELQLYSPKKGYIFLAEEQGHWELYRPKRNKVRLLDPRSAYPKQTFEAYNTTFKVFERSDCEIDYVEGELSWVAKKGDNVQYMDAIAPPHVISAEWTKTEMEWTTGHYLTPDTVANMFKIDVNTLAQPTGVGKSQPFNRSSHDLLGMRVGFAVAAVLALLAIFTVLKPATTVVSEVVSPNQYLGDNGAMSGQFLVPAGSNIYRLTTHSNVRGGWIGLATAFVNNEDKIVQDTESVTEYYSGYEGGESWTENNRRDTKLFRLDGPDDLRMNVFGNQGSWPYSNSSVATDVRVRLQSGVLPTRYFVVALILVLIFPVLELMRKVTFESRRWPSDDDDDDDWD